MSFQVDLHSIHVCPLYIVILIGDTDIVSVKMSCSQIPDHLLPPVLVERPLLREHLLGLLEEVHHLLRRLHVVLHHFGIRKQACFIRLDLLVAVSMLDCEAAPESSSTSTDCSCGCKWCKRWAEPCDCE